MYIFLKEYLWTLFALTLLAFAGGFAVIPFKNTLKFSLFATPLAGILLVAIGTSAFYSLFNFTVITSSVISITLCIATSLVTAFYLRSSLTRPNFKLLIIVGLVVIYITYITNYATLSIGQTGFLYMGGTDHLGYAHLADWLNNHLASQRPGTSAELPYESWPNTIFSSDPRFGSFFILSFFSKLRNHSAMFSYDFSCGVILSAAILAIAAIYSRSGWTFILLLVGLLSSSWLDFSRDGFFGKLLGYPSSLFLIGLFLISIRPLSTTVICLLIIFLCGCTIMHSAFSTAIFLFILGFSFIFFDLINNKLKGNITIYSVTKDNVFLLSLIIGLAFAISGMLALPAAMLMPPSYSTYSWFNWILPHIFDFDLIGYSIISRQHFIVFFIITNLIALIFFIISLRKHETITSAFIFGPYLFLFILILSNAKSPAYQFIGTFYPWFLCAAVRLVDNIALTYPQQKFLFYGLSSLVIISIALHIPNLIEINHYYAGSKTNKSLEFSRHDFDTIAEKLSNHGVNIDIAGTQYALPLLVELGCKTNIQWLPASWESIVGYRSDWPKPKMHKSKNFLLVAYNTPIDNFCKIIFKTNQYQLLDCGYNNLPANNKK